MSKKSAKTIVKDFLKEKLKVTTKDDVLNRNAVEYWDLDYDVRLALHKFCYFCGEDILIESHHVIPRDMCARYPDKYTKETDEQYILPMCPNHHLSLHRGVSNLWFHKGKFYLDIKCRKILPPHSLNFLIKRSLHENSVEYHYGNLGSETYTKFKISPLQSVNYLLIGRKQEKMYVMGYKQI